MPYIMTGADGHIVAVRPDATSKDKLELSGWEYVEGNSKAYREFLEAAMVESDPFRESDIQLARVLEDLIALLIDREVIRFTDFPAAAQKRLLYRQNLRNTHQVLNILDDNIRLPI